MDEIQIAIGDQFAKYAMKFCIACFFVNARSSIEDRKINNGTCSLIKIADKQFGITNKHVIDEYRRRSINEDDIHFYIGNCKVDVEDIIHDESDRYDLVVFDLSKFPIEEIASYGEIPTHYHDIETFDVETVQKDEFILFGGYPGCWRNEVQEGSLFFDSMSSGSTRVYSISDENITCQIEMDRCETNFYHGRNGINSFGGISGGPVFYHTYTKSGLSKFVLVGVIYEYNSELDILKIRPLNLISDNGMIKIPLFG